MTTQRVKINCRPDPQQAGALYIHVPFCRAKCRYCDFYSVLSSPGRMKRYVRAVETELRKKRPLLTEPAASVFIGGGTPTVLGGDLLILLLGAVKPLTDIHTEFSLEANPSSVDASIADVLVKMGVNRVSLGVQSFQADELHLLGRIHTARQARQAVKLLRDAGIANLSLDLIYGIPNQTLGTWRDSLRQSLDLGIKHLSCYALSFERGTKLWEDRRAGRVVEISDILQRSMYEQAITSTGNYGMEHYEISNFALPGAACRHNLTYWRNEPYIGIGPASASYLNGSRTTTHPDLDAYESAIEAGLNPPAQSERLEGKSLMAETAMLGLRMTEGIDRKAFSQRFGADPTHVFPLSITRYLRLGALVVTATHVRLAQKAYFVADSVMADILAET